MSQTDGFKNYQGRICEIEEITGNGWNILKQSHKNYLKLLEIKKFLQIETMEYSFVDKNIMKITLVAMKPGKFYYIIGILERSVLGIKVIIRNENDPCMNELKKPGLIIDRGLPIEIRVGDTLLLYISQR